MATFSQVYKTYTFSDPYFKNVWTSIFNTKNTMKIIELRLTC